MGHQDLLFLWKKLKGFTKKSRLKLAQKFRRLLLYDAVIFTKYVRGRGSTRISNLSVLYILMVWDDTFDLRTNMCYLNTYIFRYILVLYSHKYRSRLWETLKGTQHSEREVRTA